MRINIAQRFAVEPPPLDFVLPGMLSGTVGALVAPGGAGKSVMALQLAILVASGTDLVGIGSLPTGRVKILAAEDPEQSIDHRLHALGKHLNPAQRERVDENVDILPFAGVGYDVFDDDWYNWTLEIASGARLLMFDTLRRVHLGDENDSGAMAELVSRLEKIVRITGCSILFLHHSSKSAAMNGHGDMQQASRGSSVLVDNIRWQSYMSGMTKEEAKVKGVDDDCRGLFVRWGVSKQNYGKPISECWLRRHEGGVLLPAEFSTCGVTAKKAVNVQKEVQREQATATIDPWTL